MCCFLQFKNVMTQNLTDQKPLLIKVNILVGFQGFFPFTLNFLKLRIILLYLSPFSI